MFVLFGNQPPQCRKITASYFSCDKRLNGQVREKTGITINNTGVSLLVKRKNEL